MEKTQIKNQKSKIKNGLLLLVVVASWMCGCSRPPASKKSPDDNSSPKQVDSLPSALELLRSASTLSAYREALHLVNAHLNKPENLAKLPSSRERRALLQQRLGLEAQDLKEVEATTFRPMDAHHVEQCILLRNAARSLEPFGADPLEPARRGFAWVVRNVLLREGGEDIVPPYHVLRQGEGTSTERMLVFVALLHQLKIPGCLVAVGESSTGGPAMVLAGAVLGAHSPDRKGAVEGNKDEKKQPNKGIYLFDPRRGVPVAGPGGKGICTLAQLLEAPGLAGFESDPNPKRKRGSADGPRLRVVPAVPLSALAPRMKYLQDKLAVQERIALAVEPEAYLNELSAAVGQAALPVAAKSQVVADNEADKGPFGPSLLGSRMLRVLPLFLPAAEGGTNDTGRYLRTQHQAAPWRLLHESFAGLRLGEELAPSAREDLIHLAGLLMIKYVNEPRLALIGGQVDKANKRLGWAWSALEDLDFAPIPDDELTQRIGLWREQINAAYLERNRQIPGAQERINAIWNQDQYLAVLLKAEEQPDPQAQKKDILSAIILTATRDLVGENIHYLMARWWHEKAERSQAAWEIWRASRAFSTSPRKVPKTPGVFAPELDSQRAAEKDWGNTVDWWRKYAERYLLGPRAVAPRLAAIRALWERGKKDSAISQYVDLLSQQHRAAAARLFLAEAQRRLGREDAARATLEQLKKDLSDLRHDPAWKKDLTDLGEKFGPRGDPILTATVANMMQDLGPDGGFVGLLGPEVRPGRP